MKTDLLQKTTLLLLLACATAAPCAQGFEIRVTPIATTGTPVPGTSWAFRDFGVTGGPAAAWVQTTSRKNVNTPMPTAIKNTMLRALA